jgi:hypothetical protein
VFSGNKNSSSGYGNDVAYNDGTARYTSSNTVGTCSDSLSPQISGISANRFDLTTTYCTNDIYLNTCEVEVNLDIVFYLGTDGTDASNCRKYASPCKTIDFVMREIVYKTEESIIYIDSGTFNYSVNADRDSSNSGYLNRIFNLIGYVIGLSVKIDDTDSYPIILSNTSDGPNNVNFLLFANVTVSFQYLKFIIGNNSHTNRQLIVSLYIYIYIYIIYFFNLFINYDF